MLSAKEAAKKYDELYSINKVMSNIEYCILKAINEKKRECYFYLDAIEKYSQLPQSPKTEMIVEELRNLGYQVELTTYGSSYVPAGLQDDDGNGPPYINYGLKISF